MNVMKKTISIAAAVSLVCLFSVGAMAANKLIVMDAGGTVQKFTVTDTGYIGVGTSTLLTNLNADFTFPNVPLHIVGNNINDIKITSHFIGTTALGGGGLLLFHNNDAGTNGGLPRAGDRLGSFAFGSYIGTLGVAGGIISAYADGIWTASSAPTYFSIQTAPAGTTTRTERLRITSGGNIVVGLAGLPVYATNALAAAALPVGAFYRNGGDPDHVCVVH